jgi:hypothetical protein
MALFQRSKSWLMDRLGGKERQEFSLLIEHRYAGCDRCPKRVAIGNTMLSKVGVL